MIPPGKTSLSRGMWIVALGLMLAEFLVFDRMTSRHHASVYPRWNDQIQYLTESYYAFDEMQAHGLPAALKLAFSKYAVQGILHDAAAVVVFWLTGSPSRSAALSLNMLAFLAWQASVLFSVTRVTGSRALGWMGFGLVLAAAYPWSVQPGSAVDFRLDHAAMCLFGVTACAAVLSEGFRLRGWSLAFGAAAGVTILERFLSSVYFAALFTAAGLWILAGTDRWARLRNLLLAAAVTAVMTVPVFWLNRKGILDYYWVGHLTNAESAARLRGFDLWQSIRFVFENLGRLHLGAWFGWTVAALTGGLLALRFSRPARPATASPPGWQFVALAGSLLPAMILTIHRQKSEVVLGIIVPGVILLVLWLWHVLWRRIDFPQTGAGQRLLPAVPAVLAVAGGLVFFVERELTPPSPDYARDTGKVNHLADYIYQTSVTAKLSHPSVAIDRIVDFVDGRILRVMCYERHRAWVDFGVHLPDTILEAADETVLFKWRASDFVMLTHFKPGDGYWPYDRQMRRLYPQLRAWSDENLTLVETFTVFQHNVSLYQRRDFR